MTITFGGGAFSIVYSGTICIPPLVRTGFFVSATVYKRNGISSLLGITTSWKTSHGPQKSITTAPSEIRKATGIWPLSGGFSEIVSVATAFGFGRLSVLTGAPVANNALSANTPSASRKPNRATWQTNSILFVVRAFMIRSSDDGFVAAMTTIIIFLPIAILDQLRFLIELQPENSCIAQRDLSKDSWVQKMKVLAFLLLCFATVAVADDFKLVSGKEYKNVTVTRVEPDGIVLKTKSGISKVYFVELPRDVQERFHYNVAIASAYSAQQAVNQSTMAAAHRGEPIKVISHGTQVDINQHLALGNVTVIDFYADWCGP